MSIIKQRWRDQECCEKSQIKELTDYLAELADQEEEESPVRFSPAGEELMNPEELEVERFQEAQEEAKKWKTKRAGKWHSFSPELAKWLNPRQPDITGAILIRNLFYWQTSSNKSKYQHTLVDGRRYCFRSLNDLVKDCPYLKRSQIHAALVRLEKRCGDDFKVRRDKKKYWFSIGEGLLERQPAKGSIRFEVQNAASHGVNSAIILSNSYFQFDRNPELLKDTNRNRYACLSANVLKEFLPISQDTICRCLKALVKEGVLIKHPQNRTFYALSEGFVVGVDAQKVPPAEVNSKPAEVNTQPAEVDDFPGTCHNECHKEGHKVNMGIDSASPRQVSSPLGSSISEGAKVMIELSNEAIQSLRQNQMHKHGPGSASNRSHVAPSSLAYESIHDDEDRTDPLEYGTFEASQYRLIQEKIAENVDYTLSVWDCGRIKWTHEDKRMLKRLFSDNLKLDGTFFAMIQQHINPKRNIFNIGDWSAKPGKYDDMLFLRNVKTAKHILKYLPQILFQIDNEAYVFNGEIFYCGEGWCEEQIDYSYLGRSPNSRLVHLTG